MNQVSLLTWVSLINKKLSEWQLLELSSTPIKGVKERQGKEDDVCWGFNPRDVESGSVLARVIIAVMKQLREERLLFRS